MSQRVAWPAGNSDSAALVRFLDWAATPLGPPETWPQDLRTVVDLVLAATVPMNLLWGPELIQIYNDPYARLMGTKHPRGLGQAASECWPEAWSIARPLYDRVFAGETIALRDSRRVLDRQGVPEVAYFDDFLTPVRDLEGAVRGVHVLAFETTERFQAVAERHWATEDTRRIVGSLVYVVDANEVSRNATVNLMSAAGFQVKAFATPASFLDFAQALMPGVVLLDLRQAGSGALRIPRSLLAHHPRFPVIVLDGTNVSAAVRAMRAGAVDVLACPCPPEEILAAVASAQGTIEIESEQQQQAEQARQRVAGLSCRERKVVKGLVSGGTNKSIARDLGLSPRTVEIHRAHAMERLGVKTLSEAVLMATRAGL